MTARTLTVHDTGPDGNTTYELVIGEDIALENAEELIARSGGTVVYATHHYEKGERVENFVSKGMYTQLRAMLDSIPPARTIDEIKVDIDMRLRGESPSSSDSAPLGVRSSKHWWKFWRP